MLYLLTVSVSNLRYVYITCIWLLTYIHKGDMLFDGHIPSRRALVNPIPAMIVGSVFISIGAFALFRGRIVCGALLILCGWMLLKWGASA